MWSGQERHPGGQPLAHFLFLPLSRPLCSALLLLLLLLCVVPAAAMSCLKARPADRTPAEGVTRDMAVEGWGGLREERQEVEAQTIVKSMGTRQAGCAGESGNVTGNSRADGSMAQ